jgi:hypothetical protein
MKLKSTFLLIFCIGFNYGFAQVDTFKTEICGQREVLKQLEQQYPGFLKEYDKQYLKAVRSDFNRLQTRRKIYSDTIWYYDTIYTIPVVFHVLYNVASENIHDSLLINQIEVLNRDYRRLNFDTVNTRSFFKSRAGDVRIQFELAKVDPKGVSTNGILRKFTSKTSWGTSGSINNNMKFTSLNGDDAWDAQHYLNIWVCDLTYQNQDGLLGFAYPPYGQPFWTSSSWVTDPNQGVVLHYKIVGRNNPLSNTTLLATSRMGRVAVHEVGHFFGLRHIWADDQYQFDRCSLDDYIDDTPKQGVQSNFDCQKSLNSCNEGANDLPDMIENYMDYSAHSCQNMFTKQQVIAMRNGITQFRTQLPIKTEIVKRFKVIDTIAYSDILIYSKSNTSQVIIELRNEDVKDNVSAEVYDIIGQKIIETTTLTNNYNVLSSNSMSTGTYVVVLRNPEGRVIRKHKLLVD